MKVASRMDSNTRCKVVIVQLRRAYPTAKCSLRYASHLQLLVATILSAQCTDKRVNFVTRSLFKKYRTAKAFAYVDRKELEQDIKSTGFYRNKAKNIQGACRAVVEQYGGDVPASMSKLLDLPGVGRKTANVILGVGFGINEGVVVDTHVTRISNRLGFTMHQNPVKIEQDLIKIIPKQDWIDFAHLLIAHGRAVCTARKPKCPACPVKEHCPSAQTFFPELKKVYKG